MQRTELLERLRAHPIVGEMPAAEMEWLASHGRYESRQEGDLIVSEGSPVDELYIVFTGRFEMYRDRGGGPRKVIGWGGGEISGLLPYSRMTTSLGRALVVEAAEFLTVHRSQFSELIRECPGLTSRLVQLMLDRARYFTQNDLQHEKMASLGRLAAGLAHELDNPASAVVRDATRLIPLLRQVEDSARELGMRTISPDELVAIQVLRDQLVYARTQPTRSPLDHARYEEELARWLEDHGLDLSSLDGLVEASITVEMLATLAAKVDGAVLDAAVRSVAAGCALMGIAGELGEAARRISDLVGAVKGFTRLDRGATPQPVEIEGGLSQTLAILRSKARSASARMEVVVAPDLPRVLAVGVELNQIWYNVIDNALDAVHPGGSVQITAGREGDFAVVRIVDDGPGIPADMLEQVFEPFFTTKAVGKGTGLGLDIARRLVEGQNGTIEVTSRPGRTEFRVAIPVASEESPRIPALAAAEAPVVLD